ncbi:S9 family peptidase [Ruminococcaceae bacterium OttesenSCG-928-A16]|nr:S9 family peptidase [Ruminococcaceae bacterium OttesenSCG-928-A16]
MKPVEIDHFKEYLFPSMLRSNGAGLVSFIGKKANMKKNTYNANLWLLQPQGPRQLTFSNNVTAAWWKDADTLVFARTPEADKKEAETGLPFTILQSLSVSRAGEASEFLRLPYDIEDLAFLPDGRFLFVAEYNPKIEALLQQAGQNAQKAAALLAEENDYEVLTELPFWANGSGFTSGVRQRLYLYANGNVTPLVGKHTNVSQLRLAPGGGAAFYVAQTYTAKAPVADCLMKLDLNTLQSQDISVGEPFVHNAYAPLSTSTVLVHGSDMQDYGINQNGNFYRLHLATGQTTLLYQAGEYDSWDTINSDLKMPAEAQWFAVDNMVYWLGQNGPSTQLLQIDANTGEIRSFSAQPGCVSELAPLGDDIVFSAMHGLNGPELYRYSFEDDTEQEITSLNTAVASRYAFSQPEPLSFENSEGNSVRGWVMKPTFFEEGQTYPAILTVHGGPKTAYNGVLFHDMQYWASQGYAVFFCNPTGSSGQGDEFGDLRERYGLIDYDDLMQFTDIVLEQNPWIDPEALAITGGSYGGFITNWVVGHTNRFKAAVSERGIANWATMHTLADIGYFFEPDQAGADLWTDYDALWEQSPLKYADRVTTPTLFIHSQEDYRCPLPEGMQMYAALQNFGIETRLCLFKGENHNLSRTGKPRHRVRRLQEITDWFDTYLKP